MKFRRKPVEVEAVRWNGEKFENKPPQWIVNALNTKPGTSGFLLRFGDTLRIQTLNGQLIARPGDWLVNDEREGIFPLKHGAFKALYELAGE